jgi:hypothetical protein
MSRRKIEMHQYRQALMRMRQGDSDRDIAKSGLMGRLTALKPAPLLGVGLKCASELSNSGLAGAVYHRR